MKSVFCATVLNKVKWVVNCPKTEFYLYPLPPAFSPTRDSINTCTQKHTHLNQKVNNNLKEQA